MNTRENLPDEKRAMLCHFLASIAYRTQKAVRDAPDDYFQFRGCPGLRTPHQIIRHMTSVLGYARTFFVGGRYSSPKYESPKEQIKHFHEILESLRGHLVDESQFINMTPERMLQEPFADAMSHVGQLSMLRRLFGSPVPPENFIVADIDAENVTSVQSQPVSPDAVWRDAEGNIQK